MGSQAEKGNRASSSVTERSVRIAPYLTKLTELAREIVGENMPPNIGDFSEPQIYTEKVDAWLDRVEERIGNTEVPQPVTDVVVYLLSLRLHFLPGQYWPKAPAMIPRISALGRSDSVEVYDALLRSFVPLELVVSPKLSTEPSKRIIALRKTMSDQEIVALFEGYVGKEHKNRPEVYAVLLKQRVKEGWETGSFQPSSRLQAEWDVWQRNNNEVAVESPPDGDGDVEALIEYLEVLPLPAPREIQNPKVVASFESCPANKMVDATWATEVVHAYGFDQFGTVDVESLLMGISRLDERGQKEIAVDSSSQVNQATMTFSVAALRRVIAHLRDPENSIKDDVGAFERAQRELASKSHIGDNGSLSGQTRSVSSAPVTHSRNEVSDQAEVVEVPESLYLEILRLLKLPDNVRLHELTEKQRDSRREQLLRAFKTTNVAISALADQLVRASREGDKLDSDLAKQYMKSVFKALGFNV